MLLLKAWAFMKSYWYVPVAIAGVLLIVSAGRKGRVDWRGILDDAGSAFRKERKAIDDGHRKEVALREAALHRAHEAERQIREEFDRNERVLDVKKEKRVKRILKQLADDPQALANELEKETGIRIVLVQ